MKKLVLVVALVTLIFSEIYLCTPFLPTKWQAAMSSAASHILPRAHDQWDVTHPALDQEIDQVLRNNPSLPVGFDTFVAMLLAGNTVLLVWVLRLVRRPPQDRIRRQA